MISRPLNTQKNKSFFLFGPRGTGKSTWVQKSFPNSPYIDLLDDATFQRLLTHPDDLEGILPKKFHNPVVIDEVQRIPALLNEVHRLIENRGFKFALTGSNARKLRRQGVNLLAGRALTYNMYPFTAHELGDQFVLSEALKFGMLPSRFTEPDPERYLASYIQTYLKEEIQYEGLTRNLGAFSRFLEAASFSQASQLNISSVSRDCAVERKVVENYFSILEDLLIGFRLPVFTKKAKREMVAHPKFYFFDVGVFQTLRPKGPLDSPESVIGPAFETLILQELRALNHYFNCGYEIYYWRTKKKQEVDFVLYGRKGLVAIEAKSSPRLRREDFDALLEFAADYPVARCHLVYGGQKTYQEGPVQVVPAEIFFQNSKSFL